MADATATPEVKIDLTNYVPKTEFDKIQAQASASQQGLETLKSQLLDRDYLDYLEARKNGNQRPAAPQSALTNVDLKNLDMAGLVELIQKHTLAVVTQSVGPKLHAMRGTLTDVQAFIELDQVRGKYEDFDTYSKDVTSILERTQNDLTIEQAYLMAKAQAPLADAGEDKTGAAKPTGAGSRSERPTNVIPLDGETVKTFKDANAAGQAAASEVLARHGLSGDTL